MTSRLGTCDNLPLHSVMEGHNWLFNQFVEIPRRSIIVSFLSLLAKAGLNLHHLRWAVYNHKLCNLMMILYFLVLDLFLSCTFARNPTAENHLCDAAWEIICCKKSLTCKTSISFTWGFTAQFFCYPWKKCKKRGTHTVFAVVGIAPIPAFLLVYTGRASTCHIEERIREREGR